MTDSLPKVQPAARQTLEAAEPGKLGEGSAPPIDILLAARAHFQSGKIGAPDKYERPFTVQLKSDTRRQFPADEKFYA